MRACRAARGTGHLVRLFVLLVAVAYVCSCWDDPWQITPVIGVHADGEKYALGSTCTIHVNTNTAGLTHVHLELSRDGGESWETLAPSFALPSTIAGSGEGTDVIVSGEFPWVVTDDGVPLPQTQCLLRARDAADGDPVGASEPFAIREKVVWHVDAKSPGGGDGLSWATAHQQPQDVFMTADAVAAGDEVWVAKGTYTQPAGYNVVVDMVGAVGMYGGFAGTETDRAARDWRANPTVLDGEGAAWSVVWVFGGNVNTVLDGFTVTGGNAIGSDDCGGGIWINHADPGMRVANCTIAENTAEGDGGGVCLDGGAVEIENCVFSSNSASANGGAICLAEGNSSAAVSNCVFSGNSAGGCGGAVYDHSYSTVSIWNCTFWANTATSGGPALFSFAPLSKPVVNCIFWDNMGEGGVSLACDVTYSDVQGGPTGVGNIDADPLFVNAPAGDFHLGALSPCVNAGNPATTLTEDLDGNPRPAWSGYDMGAYEYQ